MRTAIVTAVALLAIDGLTRDKPVYRSNGSVVTPNGNTFSVKIKLGDRWFTIDGPQVWWVPLQVPLR